MQFTMRDPVSKQYSFSSFLVTVEENLFILKIGIRLRNSHYLSLYLLHFVAFFHVASLFSIGVDKKKVVVENVKALVLTNCTVFLGLDGEKALDRIIFSYFTLISM